MAKKDAENPKSANAVVSTFGEGVLLLKDSGTVTPEALAIAERALAHGGEAIALQLVFSESAERLTRAKEGLGLKDDAAALQYAINLLEVAAAAKADGLAVGLVPVFRGAAGKETPIPNALNAIVTPSEDGAARLKFHDQPTKSFRGPLGSR